MIPSPDDVRKEIEALREMKPKVRQYSAFGDDHHAAIQAQIEVLEENLDDDEIYDRFGEDRQSVLGEALEALEWMCGENDDAPSVGWKDLIVG